MVRNNLPPDLTVIKKASLAKLHYHVMNDIRAQLVKADWPKAVIRDYCRWFRDADDWLDCFNNITWPDGSLRPRRVSADVHSFVVRHDQNIGG